MAIILLVAFIAVPLIEIAVFIQLGGLLGLWPTLGLVILTAVVGTWLLRLQGLATLLKAQQHMQQGVLPKRELFDGFCLLFAGALLLTPGFVTDGFGLALFIPAFRDLLRRLFSRFAADHVQTKVWTSHEAGTSSRPGGKVIDGEFRDVTDGDGESNDKGPQR